MCRTALYLTQATTKAVSVLADSPSAASSITLLLNTDWPTQVQD